MKREYQKPVILFESFNLSTNIAGDCEHKTNLPSNTSCGIEMEGVGFVFLTGMTGCEGFPIDRDVNNDGDFGGICYHVPAGGENLFNS